MKKIEFLEEEYEDILMKNSIVSGGTESTILRYDDYLLKILFPPFLFFYTKRKMHDLGKLENLRDYLTLPIADVYIDFRYVGFGMFDEGISLAKLLLESPLTLEDKKRYMLQLKDAIINMHDADIVHGDIQPSNILIKDGKVKIGDINNVKFASYHMMYFNALTGHLRKYYGRMPIIDIQSFNYFTYMLFNLDENDLKELAYYGADFFRFEDIRNIDNKYFNSDVCDEQMRLIYRPLSRNEAIRKSKYLIDYLDV